MLSGIWAKIFFQIYTQTCPWRSVFSSMIAHVRICTASSDLYVSGLLWWTRCEKCASTRSRSWLSPLTATLERNLRRAWSTRSPWKLKYPRYSSATNLLKSFLWDDKERDIEDIEIKFNDSKHKSYIDKNVRSFILYLNSNHILKTEDSKTQIYLSSWILTCTIPRILWRQ